MSVYNPTPADVALATLFRADWFSSVVVDTSWATDIGLNQSDDEARRGLVDRPFRTLTVQHTGASGQGFDAALLSEMIAAQTEGRPLVPIWSDFATLTGAYTAGGTALATTETAYRRFFVGQPVFVVSPPAPDAVLGGSASRYAYATATVTSVGGNSLGISAMGSNFAAGARVFPALRSNMALEVSARLVTRRHAQSTWKLPEIAGASAAPALWTPGSLPSGEPSYAGYPVFTIPEDWSNPPTVQSMRQGAMTLVGLDNLADIYGVRPRRRFELTFTLLQRAQAWRLLRFFDSRAGRLHPFWFPGPTEDLAASSYASASVTCRPGFPTVAEASKHIGRHVSFVLRNGTVTIRRVTGVTDAGGGAAAIAFTPAIDTSAITPQTVRRASWCYLSRFDTDAISERWITDQTLRTEASIMELRNNGDAESIPSVPDVPSPVTGEAPPPPWSPDANCFQDPAATVPMYQNPCGSCDPDRPVFRVSDVALPAKIRVKFKKDQWSKDAAHSHGGTLAALIAKLESTWVLDVVPGYTWATPTSRHWHHVSSAGGGSWSLTPPTVTRHLWRATSNYVDDFGATRTVEVRFVAEFETTPTSGHWGARFYVAAFSDEINPSYVDGTAFAGTTFYRDDPGVWDGSQRLAHPQCAIMAEVPTTFESPCGGARYVPASSSVDVNFVAGDAETNFCSKAMGNIPWAQIPGGSEEDNSVFGTAATGYRGMTLNAGCSTSEVMEWLVCENTPTGYGLTALKPTNLGWKWLDDYGGIDFENGSSAELIVCDPGQTPGSCCSGHASTPNPGTATCWKPSPTAAVQGCFSRSSRAKITLTTVAGEARACYDADGNVTESTATNPVLTRFLSRTIYADVWDCGYVEGGTQTGRAMRWVYRETDSKATSNSAIETFDDNLLTNWTTVFGTWNAVAGKAVATAVGGTDVDALLLYTAYSSFEDVEVSARVGDPTKRFGLMVRASSSGTGTTSGYYFEIDPTSTYGSARIYRYDTGTMTLLAEINGVPGTPITLAANDLVKVSAVRSSLSIVKNHPLILQATAQDCTYTTGSIGIGTNGAAGQSWNDVVIIDKSVPVGVATVLIDETGWTVTVDAALMPGYGTEFDNATENPSCGSTEFDCCRVERDFEPKSISESQSGSSVMNVPPGGGRPPSMPVVDGVIGDFVACVVEIIDNGECGTPPGGFETWSNSAISKVVTP